MVDIHVNSVFIHSFYGWGAPTCSFPVHRFSMESLSTEMTDHTQNVDQDLNYAGFINKPSSGSQIPC